MAIYHLSVKICGRGRGIGGSDQSPIASAAYQSGEKLYNEKDGEIKNYGRKERIVAQGLMLAKNFPQDWDRERLWNEVERAEKNKNAQLYRKWEMALPTELSDEQNIEFAKKFVKKYFVRKGMCADWAIHGGKNPHLHVMTTVRGMDQNHQWQPKKRKEYILDFDGQKQYDKKTKTYKCTTKSTNDWHTKDFLHKIRKAWADEQNTALKQAGYKSRVSEKSYKDLAKNNQLYHYLRPTKHRGQSLKYDNQTEMAHNEKIIRTYIRDGLRHYHKHGNIKIMKKITHDCANIAGFNSKRIQNIVDVEKENLKNALKKIGTDALKPEINWELLSEYERADLTYKQSGYDL